MPHLELLVIFIFSSFKLIEANDGCAGFGIIRRGKRGDCKVVALKVKLSTSSHFVREVIEEFVLGHVHGRLLVRCATIGKVCIFPIFLSSVNTVCVCLPSCSCHWTLFSLWIVVFHLWCWSFLQEILTKH